ncbi:MAG: hypothetical protein H6713_20820 [Myxococcales bacterium]|nr:hypothetical protein [Myxococcales bacterium]MCB9752404.1 hypothetical protein [Myxococcales bacterium]
MKKLLLLLPAALALGFLGLPAGCGGDPCVKLCEDARACDEDIGYDDRPCADQCSEQADQAEQLGCGSEYDDFTGCVAKFDPCGEVSQEEAEACQDEFEAFFLACGFGTLTD